MIRFLTPAAFVLLSACAGGIVVPIGNTPPRVQPPAPIIPPPTPVRTAKERFVAAVEANGCELNASNAAAIQREATIAEDELQQIVVSLSAEGRVKATGDTSIRIVSDRCVA